MLLITKLKVETNDSQQTINAEILISPTGDTREPVEIIITSKDDLLLYF